MKTSYRTYIGPIGPLVLLAISITARAQNPSPAKIEAKLLKRTSRLLVRPLSRAILESTVIRLRSSLTELSMPRPKSSTGQWIPLSFTES